MSTLEIKGGLYELISKVHDEQLLMQLYELIGDIILQNMERTDFWDELSPAQQQELDAAIQQSYEAGNLVPHTEVFNRYKEWLFVKIPTQTTP
jgi:hypothetical protein